MTHGIEFIASHFFNLRLTQSVTGKIDQRKPDNEHLQLADSFNIEYSNRKATSHFVERLLSDVSEAVNFEPHTGYAFDGSAGRT